MRSAIRIVTALAVLATCLALGVACSKHEGTPTGLRNFLGIPASTVPAPDSPAGALRLLQWCWVNRDANMYATVLADDYAGACSETDSAHSAFGGSITRFDELQIAKHLFEPGFAYEPPATSITFDYMSDLVAVPDGRPGKDAGWHQEIHAQVLVFIDTGVSAFQVKGPVMFFLVRGDSASIPADLAVRGFGPDPNRWYIERWEDATGSPGLTSRATPAHPAPVGIFTWCDLKAKYR